MKQYQKFFCFCLLLFLLLIGCETETVVQSNEIAEEKKEETTFEFEVPVEENRAFLVKMEEYPDEQGGEAFHSIIKAKIFDKKDNSTPIQTFEHEGIIGLAQRYIIEDVNFDGYNDFYYVYFNAPNVNYVIWVWNPQKNMFEESSDLEDLYNISFDKEKEVVEDYIKGVAGTGSHNYYKYIDGKLKCIRSFDSVNIYNTDGEINDEYKKLICKDWIDGELKTVIEVQVPTDFVWAGEEGRKSAKFSEIDSETKQQVEEFWNYYYDIDYPKKKW